MISGVAVLAMAGATAACGDEPTDPSTSSGTVSGLVTASPAGGIEGVLVTLSRSGFASVSATSAANGAFAITDVPAGTWSLTVQPPAGMSAAPDQTDPVPVEVVTGGIHSVTFRLVFLAGDLTGTIVDARGVGVVGARVGVARPSFPVRTGFVAGDGSFAIRDLEAGPWQMTVTLPAGAQLAAGEAEERTVQVVAGGTSTETVLATRVATGLPNGWELLENAPAQTTSGRHDDIFFLDINRGWLVNTDGRILRTRDGGATWQLQANDPGVRYRSVGFADENTGWVGNLNGFRDPDPRQSLYETRDGGATWTNITDRVDGPDPVGVCGIWVVDAQTIYGVGRWHGPAIFVRSRDGGTSWESFDLTPDVTGLVDVFFFDEERGLIVGGRGVGPEPEQQEASVAVILGTEDGGDTWQVRYEGSATGKWGWKFSFPTPDTGYVATQGPTLDGVVLKTVDAGQTWEEIVVGAGLGFSGIGFADASTGWVGAGTTTWETTDGGASWTEVTLDVSLNRFRMLGPSLGFAAGQRVSRFTGR